MLLDLTQPSLHIIKGLHVRRVEGEQDSMGSLVIRLRDRAEPLLASCIPNLQFHALSVDLDVLDLKINTCGIEKVKNY